MKDLVYDHGFYDLEGGKGKIFWCSVAPKNPSEIENVLIQYHGFGEHSGWLSQNMAITMAKLHNSAVVMFDMPVSPDNARGSSRPSRSIVTEYGSHHSKAHLCYSRVIHACDISH